MAPAYLNPPSSPCPLVDQREDQHDDLKLSISTHTIQASSSLSTSSCPTFFDRIKDEIGSIFEDQSQEHDEKKSVEEDGNINPHKLSLCQREEEYGDQSKNTAHDGPVQYSCMSSKKRWMQKMMDPNCPAANNKPVRIIYKKFQNNLQNGDSDQLSSPNCSSNSTNSNARVCADCNTTTTPLWRGGPRGPKSLCNACGIRQRKARRAMAEAAAAANGMGVAPDISSKKKKKINKLHKKENKSGTKNLRAAQYKKNKYCKFKCPSHSEMMSVRKQLSFKDFALSLRNSSADLGRVFPQDEAEAAAILLMELSCGALVHS
ncbi:putative GATA transcription factor 22 [Juglans microcarpa x Juglans regia]|uniref:putative GATA transcription factor 22 n=1 Tax=Juglans microcarpa x Juglans regia TaxID=2249226 RepID=UPI001B7DA71E|nr:putative GATA transcription factor 22 [Juglans microcarpa x Juglans regia]